MTKKQQQTCNQTGHEPADSQPAHVLCWPKAAPAESLSDLAVDVGLSQVSCSMLGDAIETLGIVPLTAKAFASFVHETTSKAGLKRTAPSRALRALFEAFDTNGNGTLDRSEVAGGLSTLVQGSAAEKAEMAFRIYDNSGDGLLSLEELTVYFTSVFRVLLLFAGQRQDGLCLGDASPEEIAVDMATHAFESLDIDGDGKLSLDEFKHWFEPTAADTVPVKVKNHLGRLKGLFPDADIADIDAALQASHGILIRAAARLRMQQKLKAEDSINELYFGT